MLKKFYDWVCENILSWILTATLFGFFVFFYTQAMKTTNTVEYKDFKEGIQNHLVWSIKKECYFVRPINDVVVHLIRVPDCDKP